MKTGAQSRHSGGVAGHLIIRPPSGASSPFVNLAGRRLWHNAVLPSAARRVSTRRNVWFLFCVRPAAKRSVYGDIYSRCCGIDVHKDSVTACVLVYRESAESEVRKKEFATHMGSLIRLRQWLAAQKVRQVAMESTGVYWKPVWTALEGHFELILANPLQVKQIPGRKTDARDSPWIAELPAHGLIRPSFVPPVETRQLRDLTRYRVKLVEERHRAQPITAFTRWEDACIQLDTVAPNILGASGRAMIQAIIAGQENVDWLADKAQRAQLRLVLRGRVSEHHRLMLRERWKIWSLPSARSSDWRKRLGLRPIWVS